ncbi:TMEM175 family protein [Microbacterium sp. A93]|uniref:TMEM175 family protein n=1 Tax=Microbacterium sp. A93 TaxID=3450716 RepID=UPI003F436327
MTKPTTFAPERLKAFVDAVVAIAMTLLILPLLEAVSDAASSGIGTGPFLDQHRGQIISFGLSFVLIATFWMEHHRQYERVRRISPPLLWINFAWMFTIVWLPVPTAMLGQMEPDPIAAWVHVIGYFALLLVALSGPLEKLLLRMRG